MPSLPVLLARTVPLLARVSPRLAGAVALRLFFTTGPHMRVRPADAPTHSDARRGTVTVRGIEVTTYEWGRGPRTVLLLHGWRGRASQFAPLVRELVAEGFRVLAFDGPAHGSSGGRATDVRDWVTVAERLQAEHGPFEALISHSFGALGALTAARTTVPVPAVAVLAGAAAPEAFLAQFASDLRLDEPTAQNLRERFHRRLAIDEAAAAERFDAGRHPLPDGTALLVVHDRGDRRLPDRDALRLHAAHPGRSRMLRTVGLGHTKVLSADPTLDAVVALVTGGLPAVDALGTATAATPPTRSHVADDAEPAHAPGPTAQSTHAAHPTPGSAHAAHPTSEPSHAAHSTAESAARA